MNKDNYIDFHDATVGIGLSSGINSAALLCCLAQYPEQYKPKQLLLYGAHFVQHSPDSLKFLTACLCYAFENFKNVKAKITWNDVIKFFQEQNMIPHPTVSPCSRKLKYEPSEDWMFNQNNCDFDLVGFVKEELKRRSDKQDSINKLYPIGHVSNEQCFEIVDAEIGWHPAIYDFRCGVDGTCKKCKKKQQRGLVTLGCKARIFAHNNCIPCKNGGEEDYENWDEFYPEYTVPALILSEQLTKKHGVPITWGRNKSINMCKSCEFD